MHRGVREKEPPPCTRCGCRWDAHTHYRRPALTLRAQTIWRKHGVTENECSLCHCPQYQPPQRGWLSSLLRGRDKPNASETSPGEVDR